MIYSEQGDIKYATFQWCSYSGESVIKYTIFFGHRLFEHWEIFWQRDIYRSLTWFTLFDFCMDINAALSSISISIFWSFSLLFLSSVTCIPSRLPQWGNNVAILSLTVGLIYPTETPVRGCCLKKQGRQFCQATTSTVRIRFHTQVNSPLFRNEMKRTICDVNSVKTVTRSQ